MEPLGRTLVLFGALPVLVGLLLTGGPQIPLLGRLPGDLRIERPGLRVHLPLGTCLLLSVLLSLLLSLLSRWR